MAQSSGRKPKAVEVLGIVHPLGAGGGRLGGETRWTLRFSFAAWRRAGGAIEEGRLRLEKPKLDDAQLSAETRRIKPYAVLRVRLRFSATPSVWGDPLAEVVEILGKDASDKELNARARQLRKPVTVDHPFFGTVTLNRAHNGYEVEFPWNARPVQLYLSRNGCADEQELFGTAQSLWKQQKKWDKRLRDYAAENLLELKNDLWLGEDEKEFTPTKFKARMKLEAVAVSPGGKFEFTYDDGNLFWGHVIQVSGTVAEGPTVADIAG